MLFAVHLFSFGVFCFFLWKIGDSFVNSMVEKLRESLEEVIFEQVGYLIYYHRNMKALRTELEKLGISKKVVKHSVHEAQNNGQCIGDGVYSWLKTVDRINREVKMLEDEAKLNKSWLNGWCPDLIARYSLSWEAKKKTQDVIGLQRDNTRFILADFKSRIKIMDEIMEALKDDSINAIGVCGLGGVGKTTMVKKVRKRAEVEKLFDETVMTVVSQDPDPKKIQAEIAGRLDLNFKEKDDFPKRADLLRNKLMDCKKRLLILDDVWKMLDLEAIGIPFGGVYMACKVMVTSRSQDVCRGMKKVPIGVLPEEEAWSLFKEKAGNSIEDSPNLCEIAKKVVKECGGLPIAIVTVRAALKGKEVGIWEDALSQLQKHIPENISGLTQDVYRSIELSYDSLESQEAKSCLLLCCQYEEDTNIPFEDLVRYGMGLDLFKGIDAVAEARKRVGTLVDKLKGCYLLLDGERKEYRVKVHDVVRDVIRFKATEGKEAFMFGDDQQCKEWATKGTHLKYSLILNSNKIDLLLLEGPHFQPSPSSEAVDDLLEGMKELSSLSIFSVHSVLALTSLSSLTKLRTLCLHKCHNLKNMYSVGELKTLIILSFKRCPIVELPPEIGNLTHLKLLDLTYCHKLRRISPGVISRLKQLEELYLERSGLEWVVGEEGKQENKVNLEELGSLRNLIALTILLPTADFPGSNSLFKNLLSFRINISPVNDRRRRYEDEYEFQKELHLNLDDTMIPVVDSGINELLTKTDALFLKLKGVKKVLDDPTPLNHVQLRALEISSWEGAEYLFDTVDLDPHLKLLEIRDVHNLKRTCHGKLPAGSFKELRHIKVNRCHTLENLFSPSVAEGLVQLQSLWIERCKMMEEIIATKRREHGESTKKIRFPKLSRLSLVNLPSLVSFCKSMEEIEFPQLSYLHLSHLPKIGSLFPNSLASQGKHDTTTQCLSNEKVTFPSTELFPSLHKLRTLYVQGCNKLLNVVPSDLLQGLSNLQRLTVIDCASLVEVFEVEVLNVEKVTFPSTELFPSLHKLSTLCVQGCNKLLNVVPSDLLQGLSNLQNVTVTDCASLVEVFEVQVLNVEKVTFPSTELFPSLHKLSTLYVQGCNNLLNVVPSNLLQGLSNLKQLTVKDCALLVEVFEVRVLNIEESDIVPLSKLKELYLAYLPELTHILKREPKEILFFQSLRVLYVWNCNKLKNLFLASMAKSAKQLQNLRIEKCEMMEEIVIKGENEEEYKTDKIIMPQLKMLTLCDLLNLTSFYQSVNAFELPSLEHVTIKRCPKMKTYPFGFVNTPKPVKVDILLSQAEFRYQNLIQDIVIKQSERVNQENVQQEHFEDNGNDNNDDKEINQEIGQQEHLDYAGDGNDNDNKINQNIGQQEHLDGVGDGNDDDNEIDLNT